MKLSIQEADHFWELMWALQLSTGKANGMLPSTMTREEYAGLPQQDKLAVRDSVFDDLDAVVKYAERNPDSLSPDDVKTVASWQHAVIGEFFIERLLKRYAVFIGGDKVYGVLGLYDAFDVFFHPRQLPTYVRAILLPYRGKIVYDGLLQGYNILVGGNIARELKETYLAAKQAGMIITSLGTTPGAQSEAVKLPDLLPIIAEMKKHSRKLKGPAASPPSWSPAFSLLRASLDLAEQSVASPNDIDALWNALQKAERALSRYETMLSRAERHR